MRFCLVSVLLLLTAYLSPVYAERIITLAPAITETVFVLGKGDKIVGNTTFCNYPEAARKIPRIGGLMDINIEVLIGMKPDVIIAYPDNYETVKIMEGKARIVVIKHTGLNDLYDGIISIAKALDVEAKGKETVASIKRKLDDIRKGKMAGKKKIKTLLIISRSPDNLNNMYIIGAKDFLNDLLDAAGGTNAYTGNINYPGISIESVVAMNPDAIIELSAFNEGIKDNKVLDLWKKFPYISAVKNNKIMVVKDSKWVIPGPRISEIAEEMYHFFSSFTK
jgi:iron complex transport system substrate-binding protein